MRHIWKQLTILTVAGLVTSCKETATFYSNNLQRAAFVQTKAESSYDFLWVLDNSGSMKPRRDYLKDNLATFLETLNSRKAINYQMAVITTDAFRDNGNLVSSSSGIRVVKSSSTANPTADFSDLVNSITDSGTSFWEQGLENSYQAIKKSSSQFNRPGVPLVIVYLTDENDYSCEENCWGVEPENNTNWKEFSSVRYINFLNAYQQQKGAETLVFPIVGVSQDRCAVPSLGSRYIQISEAMSNLGKAGSICDSDLGESYNNIAKIIADRGSVFRIGTPADPSTVKVYVNNVLQDPSNSNYIFDEVENAVVFQNKLPPEGSSIEVYFDRKK